MEQIIRKIGEDEIAVDTPNILTRTYKRSELLLERASHQADIDRIDDLLSKMDEVKEEEVNTIASKIEDMVKKSVEGLK